MEKPLTRDLLRQEADAWKRAIRVMSHEINNALAPLTSLVATARRIAGKPEHAARLDEAFETIAGRAAHLQRFLDGYARFARLPRPSRQDVEWRPFLEKLVALHPFVMPDSLPAAPARVDPAQLQQALVNLLKNAAESGSAAGEIRLTVAKAGAATVIEVADAGHGMSPEQLEQVMVPFHSTKKTGSGLGLALTREIIEAHGGQLSIRSAAGQGTTVRCLIPDEAA
jgi:two-component system nitrogen regulation sensor histidine kinase NtrY